MNHYALPKIAEKWERDRLEYDLRCRLLEDPRFMPDMDQDERYKVAQQAARNMAKAALERP